MASLMLLIAVSVFCIAASIFSFAAFRNAIEENKEFLKCRTCSIILISLGFMVHTLGDHLGEIFNESLEHGLESLAHLIIFIALFFFIKASKSLFKEAKKFHF